MRNMTSSIDVDDINEYLLESWRTNWVCKLIMLISLALISLAWNRISHALSQKYNYFHSYFMFLDSNLLMHDYFEILHHIDRKDEYKLKEGKKG